MLAILIIVVLAGAALAGYWAWRRETSTMFYRSPNSTIRPPNVSLEEYDRSVMVRRKRRRALRSGLYALAGAAVAALLFVMIGSGLARR